MIEMFFLSLFNTKQWSKARIGFEKDFDHLLKKGILSENNGKCSQQNKCKNFLMEKIKNREHTMTTTGSKSYKFDCFTFKR